MDKVIIALNTQVYADSFSQVEFLLEQKVIKNLDDIKVLGDGSLAGVDVQRFSEKEKLFREKRRVEFNIPNESFVFIYLGRINLEKGNPNLPLHEIMEESNSSYDISFMAKVIRSLGKNCKTVDMEYGNQTPVKMLFEMPSMAKAEYYLAPRVEY